MWQSSLICVTAVLLAASGVNAQTNAWTSPAQPGGFWDDSFNWSLNTTPSISHSANLITNAPTKSVVIDECVLQFSPGSTTISNLTLSAPAGSVNTLSLTNTPDTGCTGIPQLTVVNDLTIRSGGVISVDTNATLRVRGVSGGAFTIDGEVRLGKDGLIAATNGATYVGRTGVGQLTASGGTGFFRDLAVATNASTVGTLTVGGGTIVASDLAMACSLNSTGAVWVTGNGQLLLSNSTTVIGSAGVGQMTVSNGTVNARAVSVGRNTGSQGTLTVAGGTSAVLSNLTVGAASGATGTVLVTGGSLIITNAGSGASLVVGQNGRGTFVLTGGTVNVDQLFVTNGARSVFTFSRGVLTTKATTMANGQPFVVGTVAGDTAVMNLLGGTHTFDSSLNVGFSAGATGRLWVGASQLTVLNDSTAVGSAGIGLMTVSNGNTQLKDVAVGISGGSGTLRIAGGTTTLSSTLYVGYPAGGSTGGVWVTGGQLSVSGLTAIGGVSGLGQMTVSNGNVVLQGGAGVGAGGPGVLTITGGTNVIGNEVQLGVFSGSGTLTVATGLLVATNAPVYVGYDHTGRMAVSNGTVLIRNLTLGKNPGAQGTFTIDGGTTTVSSNLVLGDCVAGGATGVVVLTAGNLFVTNDTVSAVLEVRSGTLTINGGLLSVDRLVVTNPCAHIVRTGGIVLAGSLMLDPARDEDNDGMSNRFEQDNGLNPLDASDANLDGDGDGLTNLQEFQVGTDPNNNASTFRMTAIAPEGDDMRVTWMMGSGKTNALERSAGDMSGGYSNNFMAIFTVTNTVDTTTNYLDIGAATSVPSFYYRIRLVP